MNICLPRDLSIILSFYYNLVTCGVVIELIESRPSHVDIVLTGRYCPQSIIDIADMVSEVKEIKHHFTRGIKARKGIEY